MKSRGNPSASVSKPLSAFDTISLPTGAAVYDPDLIDAATVRRVLTTPHGDVGVPLPGAAGRTGVRLIEQDGQRWVRRHNVRGGWIGRLVRDSYLWLGEGRTRTFREFHLLSWMHRRGLPVPAPVAAGYHRSGWRYGCDLITAFLEDTSTLGMQVRGGAMPDEKWPAIGACIRQFHANGICHADLNAHNILLRSDGRVFLVDFDRGDRRAAGPWVQRNWSRLHRSLQKLGHPAPSGILCPEGRMSGRSARPEAGGVLALDSGAKGKPAPVVSPGR